MVAKITRLENNAYQYKNFNITFYFDTYEKAKEYIDQSKKCSKCGNVIDYSYMGCGQCNYFKNINYRELFKI